MRLQLITVCDKCKESMANDYVFYLEEYNTGKPCWHCGDRQTSLYTYENRQEAYRRRQRQQEPMGYKDTRARYREPWRER